MQDSFFEFANEQVLEEGGVDDRRGLMTGSFEVLESSVTQ
jgi:hypothetical protein